jgi:hypothetical protein
MPEILDPPIDADAEGDHHERAKGQEQRGATGQKNAGIQ